MSLGGSGDLKVIFLYKGCGDSSAYLVGWGEVKSGTTRGIWAIVPDLLSEASLGLPTAKDFYLERAIVGLYTSSSPNTIVLELFKLRFLLRLPTDDLYLLRDRLSEFSCFWDVIWEGLFLSSKKSDNTSSYISDSSSSKLSFSNLVTFTVFLPKRETFLKLASNLSSSLLSSSSSFEGDYMISFLRCFDVKRSLYPSGFSSYSFLWVIILIVFLMEWLSRSRIRSYSFLTLFFFFSSMPAFFILFLSCASFFNCAVIFKTPPYSASPSYCSSLVAEDLSEGFGVSFSSGIVSYIW